MSSKAAEAGASYDPLRPLCDGAVELVGRALVELGVRERTVPATADPPEGKGDLAFPCFPYAEALGRAPGDIAREVEELTRSMELGSQVTGGLLTGPACDHFTFTAEGPFVNVTYCDAALASSLAAVLKCTAERYGAAPPKGVRVTLEHTSANPNGPFHVGRSRNPIVGDTLARIMRAAGFDVKTEYWVNDMGKQLAILTWGMDNLDPADVPAPDDPKYTEKADHVFVGYYQRANALMEGDVRVGEEIAGIIRQNESGDPKSRARTKAACGRVLDGMKVSLDRLGISVDSYAWESASLSDGSVERVLEGLKANPAARTGDGAHYIDMAPFGVTGKNTRWAFSRSDGTSLYTTRDVAYHTGKLAGCDMAVNVLGEDHRLQSKQLAVALTLLGQPEEKLPKVVFLSFVSLPEGKMSTRLGLVVYLDQLMDEAVERARKLVAKKRPELSQEEMADIAEAVGVGAVRYNIVRIQNEKKIVFRWEDALNFEGQSAPFMQYSHARACSILRKAGMDESTETLFVMKGPAGNDADISRALSLLDHPSERSLIRTVARFPSVVRGCADTLKVHRLALYAHELASAFNIFYRDCPVLPCDDSALRKARLALVALAAGTMRNTLGMLGLAAPKSM